MKTLINYVSIIKITTYFAVQSPPLPVAEHQPFSDVPLDDGESDSEKGKRILNEDISFIAVDI